MALPFWHIAHFDDFFDHYNINGHILGTGVRGIVRTCHDTAGGTSNEYAMKIVPHTPAALKALMLQQSIPPHPNICLILRVYFNTMTPRLAALAPNITTKHAIIILTPVARHGDLFNHLKRGICTTYVFDRLLSALVHMHRHGVVHGDIKPENILCFTDGKYPHIAVTDFEFCHREDDTTWTPAGTPNFAAPEIYFPYARANDRVTTAADIWSAGIVLYTMTFLRIPIDNTLGDFRLSHFNIRIPKNAPPCVAAVLRAMLRVDPQSRITAEDARLITMV